MPLSLFWNETRYREESAALRALAACIPDDVLVAGVDLGSSAEATAAVISAKRNGQIVALYAVADDPLEQFSAQIAATIGENFNREQRYVQLHALRDDRLLVNERRLSENVVTPQPVLNSGKLLLRIADVIIASSMAEIRRWSELLGKPVRRFAFLPLASNANEEQFEPGITVYAPSTSRRLLRHVEMALEDRGLEARWITLENTGDSPRTQIVVAPEWWRAMQAATLAKRGHTVVAPAHGGEERVNTVPYRPVDALGIGFAVEAALSARTFVRSAGSAEEVLCAIDAARPPKAAGPQVSVIVRTYNRPALLGRALRSIARQSYPNVEIVVVNNGGEDVREIVLSAAGTRTVQYIDNPAGGHISVAANFGARAARGDYVAYLDDDDLMYPDHLTRAIAALEETGADLAFTDSIAEYAEVTGDTKRVLGFQVFLDREFDRDEIFAQNFAPIHSIVHRRNVFERFGYFDESLAVTDDWEMWLRASLGSRFVHVDRPTVEYSWRFDTARGNMTMTHQQQFVEAYARICERYADKLTGRTVLPDMQVRALAHQQQRVEMLRQQPERVREIMLGPQLVCAVPVGPMVDADE